jgi:hypothetical protein
VIDQLWSIERIHDAVKARDKKAAKAAKKAAEEAEGQATS